MVNLRSTSTLRRCCVAAACATPSSIAACCAAALLMLTLTGCPATNSAAKNSAAPGKVAANATAPTLQPKTAASDRQQQTVPQAQQDAAAIAAEQHAQKVQALIATSEADYKAGVQNYQSNRLDAARQDFDSAVDTMLSSGMDLKNDPQLSVEFDQLVSAVNSLEIVALKQGNGFSEKIEEAPLDAANEVTFPPDPVLVNKVTAELKTTQSDLPLVVNDYVAGFINYFTNSPKGHAHLVRSLERAGKYQAMISKALRDEGVPQDLIYLAVAESGFQPQAVNGSSGAGGMWQFMPFAGAYGLERNGYFDERFDPQKSTVAYAKYMKELYNQFGDWYLAMAAYDWGPGRVQHAVAKTGYADYWQLYRLNALPGETKNYVPGIIAAAIMAKNPQQYGLTDVVPDAPVISDQVTTNYAIDMRLVADLTGSNVPDIVALNPALLRLSTPNDIPYDLHLPAGTHDLYLNRLKSIPEEDRDSWRFHIVKDGETLDQIATAFHTRATEISTLNELTSDDPVEAGDELIIPVAPTRSSNVSEQRYKVRKGDTLITVADRFGVTVEQLHQWNHLSSSRVAPGRVLYVSEPVRLAPKTRSRRARHRSTAPQQTHSSHQISSNHAAKSSSSKPAAKTSAKSSGKPTAPHSAKKNTAQS